MSAHPNQQQINSLVGGRLSDTEADTLRDHLDHCTECRECYARTVASSSEVTRVRSTGNEHETGLAGMTSVSTAVPASETALGDHSIEGYRLIREIHRGAQGVVYEAFQRSTQRRVALKIMLGGAFAKPASKRRFEREVELAANLKHPNIVAVHDSGITSGQYYFVMDYIDGLSLDVYLVRKKLAKRELLDLFIEICQAVSYAHQRGVIHRDLKPSNIMVDAEGRPYVLDFGLAKQMDDADHSLVSCEGQILGTLPYMAPEQARGEVSEIDVRTDVYALAIILYQMLTGQYPYEVTGPVPQVLGTILEVAPTRPSSLSREVDDELETILLEALAKEKQRRYQSVTSFADDISRYLTGRPIEAKRDSGLYVLRKTLALHKVPVAFALLLFVVVTGFAVLMTIQSARIARQRDAAEQARRDEARQRLRAQQAERNAEREALRARTQAERAEEARQRAEHEEARANQRAEDLRRSLYFNQIVLAGNAYASNNIVRMKELLAGSAPDLRGWEWQRLEWLADCSRRTLLAHEGRATVCRLFDNGARLLTAGDDGAVRIWQTETGNPVRTIAASDSRIPDAVMIPIVGQVLVSAGNAMKVFNAETAREAYSLSGSEARITVVRVSPDGKYAVSGYATGAIGLWQLDAGRRIREIRTHTDRVTGIAFLPSGDRFISTAYDGKVLLHSVDGTTDPTLLVSDEDALGALAVRPDGKAFAGAADRDIMVWDTETGRKLRTLSGHDDRVTAVTYSYDGSRIASGGLDKKVKLWDADTNTELRSYTGHTGGISAVTFTPDDDVLYSAGYDGTVRIWELSAVQQPVTLVDHADWVTAVAFTPDGQTMVSADADGSVIIWSVAGRLLRRLTGHDGAIWSLAVSPDGKRIASGGEDKTIRLWDVEAGRQTGTFTPHTEEFLAIAFSPDGNTIAAGTNANSVMLWNVRTGEPLRMLSGHDAPVASVAFSPDGKQLLSASGDGKVICWNPATAARLATVAAHQGKATTVRFSPDGRRFLTAGSDLTVVLWGAQTREKQFTLRGHEEAVLSAAFSPDGGRLLTGSADKTLKLWDTHTGTEVLTLTGHEDQILSVAFSPDGRKIVSGSLDTTLRLWDAAPASERRQPARRHE